MPSYRITLDILDVLPGHAPPEVLETAVRTVRATHVVEADGLDVVGGMPRIWVRFTVDASGRDDEEHDARMVRARVVHAVAQVARCRNGRAARRVRDRWVPIA
ncbi:hypothetical protein [Arsenicicoccus dermatophilus]|uniref:hypothetical protein n=1 Tax=Arsenicicoccus dermatophilus TaxID=1076331 RepID=UPI001F4D2C0C|nr:hypothetical protein [Arsenicicoccus dermatophilus]MCH8614302.1 hypothetical protein [Arsenicicoccus dermatophilus]